MANWKKVIVSGSNAELNDIFASGNITGSNISSSGELYFSSSEENFSNVVVVDIATGKLYRTASSAIGGNVLNNPTDGDLTDGLFPFVEGTTTYTDAIDDINELLASLAPSPAPELQDIRHSSPTIDGTSGNTDGDATTAELSFGTTNAGVITGNDYTNVTGLTGLSPAGTLGAVNTDGTFTAATSTDQRLGILDFDTPITGVLNETQPQNPTDTGTNYGENAFKQGHLGSLKIYVNDNSTPKHTLDLTSTTNAIASNKNANGTGFQNVSATINAHFPNGDEFTSFVHRSGSYTVGVDDQRNGWNWARVQHVSTTGTTFDYDTNYIEWVNDSSGSISAHDVSFSSRTLKQRTPTGTRYISQIPYFTDVTVELTSSFDNAYIMTYVATNAISFSDENGNLTDFSSQNIPTLGNANPKTAALTVKSEGNFSNTTTACYFFTSSESGGTGTGAVGHGAGTDFGNGIGVRTNVVKPLRPSVSDIYQRTGSMLLIGKANTNNVLGSSADYKFLNEYGRLLAGTYNNQSDVTAGGNAWNSQTTSINTYKGLIIYGQPKIDTGLNSSNYYNYNRVISAFSDNYSYNGADFSDLYGPATPPDLSSMSHTEYSIYLRYDNGSSAVATKSVVLYGVNTTIVPNGTSLSGNNIHCYFKVPGTTGWRDMATAAPGGGYTATDDYVGCYNGGSVPSLSLGATNTSVSLPVQLVGESVPANGYAVLRIEAHKDWEGYLYRVTIS